MKKNKLFLTLLIATIFCLTLNVKAISITTDSTQQGTTDSNGKIQIKGIADGTYYVKQIRTKAGYKIIDPVSIVISSDTVDDNGYLNVDVQIPKSALLPFTGGIGNIIYTSIGLIVITCSAAIFILYKKGYDKKI